MKVFFSVLICLFPVLNQGSDVRSASYSGRVWYDKIKTFKKPCWNEILVELAGYECKNTTQWLNFAGKLLACDLSEKEKTIVNCSKSDPNDEKAIQQCVSERDLNTFKNFAIFFGMVGPLCHFQASQSIFDNWKTKLSNLGDHTNEAITWSTKWTETEVGKAPYIVQAIAGQVLPISNFYDIFKKWQFVYHAVWLMMTVIIGAGKIWYLQHHSSWFAWFTPIAVCFFLEVIATTVYESWFGYVMEIFSLNDQNIAITMRLFLLFDQIFNLDLCLQIISF